MLSTGLMLSIGLMSGTSMDGIDAALMETKGTPQHLRALGHAGIQYDTDFTTLLKAAEYTVRQQQGNWDLAVQTYPQGIKDYLRNCLGIPDADVNRHYQQLSEYLKQEKNLMTAVIQHSTHLHAELVKTLLDKMNVTTSDIAVVGYHGQTLFHQPDRGISIIVGDGQALANALNITVVNDFRRQDVEAGGQGAPFAPLYHQALAVRDTKVPLAVVNCGGISNITLIPSDDPQDLIGFDTGPGNALLDQLVKQRTQGQARFDKDGQYGKQGHVDNTVLASLYKEAIIKDNQNYFLKSPPKSLDYGDLKLISALDRLSLQDACRTLAAFTADSIVSSLDLVRHPRFKMPTHWVLAGGGWKNPVIREEFEKRLREKLGSKVAIHSADDLGWSSQYMEAEIFAYLAVRRLNQQPISFPGTTRVPVPLTGGTIYHPRAVH
jgi:anhydro-N-acetylmuramic acid kinase